MITSLWNYSLEKKIGIVIVILSLIYSYSAFVMYIYLSKLACAAFQAIRQQVRVQKSILNTLSPATAEEQILEWKRNHETVTVYVQHLNNSFGGVLFFDICCIFVGIVNNTFYLTFAIASNWPLHMYTHSLSGLCRHIFVLVAVCFISDNIRSEVFHRNNLILQVQVTFHFFTGQQSPESSIQNQVQDSVFSSGFTGF